MSESRPWSRWFPTSKNGWSFDVVGLLAVIGESSIEEHSQVITASLLCVLPRIIPAPQVFLKSSRPARMPEIRARMTGVYSGTNLESVGFFANIITPLDDLAAFAFQVLHITHAEFVDGGKTLQPSPVNERGLMGILRHLLGSRRRAHSLHQGQAEHPPRGPSHSALHDEESVPGSRRVVGGDMQSTQEGQSQALRRRRTFKEVTQDLLANPAATFATTSDRPAVPAKIFSPVHILAALSCANSIAIIIAAAIWKDGNAIISVTALSLISSAVGYASLWRPLLMKRKHTNEVPRGDVMIRTREGAFLLIRCTEEVARELYSGTEECEYYVGGWIYRMLMATGTVFLMSSIVLLGNCKWNSQIFIGASYIILNGLYWGLGLLPQSYFWDLSRYQWEDVTPVDAKRAEETTNEEDQREGHPSFTRTLWYAIRETKHTGWVELSGAAPGTTQWKKWLGEAEENARSGNRSWNAVWRKDDLMKERTIDGGIPDQVVQHAPAVEVPRRT